MQGRGEESKIKDSEWKRGKKKEVSMASGGKCHQQLSSVLPSD